MTGAVIQETGGGEAPAAERGRLSFVEAISVLDRLPVEIGYGAATSFYSLTERFNYSRPDELVDLRSGVISSPNNFAADKPLPEGLVRVTVLANHDLLIGGGQVTRTEPSVGRQVAALAIQHALTVCHQGGQLRF